MVTLVIDDQEVVAPEGTTVLEATTAAGIYIPTLCYHPDLSTFGGCRVCMVEANGKMVTACRAPIAEGMVVRTDTPEVAAFRQRAVERILASHNPDCQSCTRNNHCELQRVSAFVGITPERLGSLHRSVSPTPTDTSNPFFNLDYTRCILCGICVRTCQEINGVAAIDFTHRRTARRGALLEGGALAASRCESCGECLARCPTGALVRKHGEWPAREVKTVCPYCGVGCGIYLGLRGDRIVAVRGDEQSPVNRGELCVKGRFGYHFVNSPDRLTAPMIRREGRLVETSWDEALALIADRFTAIKAQYGPSALAGISSARCTTEENYMFQKLLRLLGTNSIDHCARL